ncbi:MAG: serine hydrolase [Streptosporangiales bacterium]|nr:serine hydrolase [Streptosporangiales bacterium]
MRFRSLPDTRARAGWFAGAVVLALGAGVLSAPWPAHLGDSTTGDKALAAEVREATDGVERMGMSVALLENGRVRRAGLGDTGTGAAVTSRTPFEIGSVTKTLTASVFADMVEDGVVKPDDKVRDVLPDREWKRGSVGDVTLAELASQRSGLPVMPLVPKTFANLLTYPVFGVDIRSAADAEELIDSAATSPRPTPGEYAYSNLGFAFLGQVLAGKAGVPYTELLRERLLDPVGLQETTVPRSRVEIPAGAAEGHDGIGRHVQPWIGIGSAPAGAGVWSTADDMATYVDAVMRGTAPGSDATKPRYPAGESRIGYAWMTSAKKGGGSIVWHNGESGGCSTFVGFDRASERTVVVLSNTTADVDAVGVELLTGIDESDEERSASPLAAGIGLLFPPLAGAALLVAALGGVRPSRRREPSRARIVSAAGSGLFLFAVTYAGAAVGALSIAGWLVGSALVGAGVFVAAVRWRRLRWVDEKYRVFRWVDAAFWAVVGLVFAIGAAG